MNDALENESTDAHRDNVDGTDTNNNYSTVEEAQVTNDEGMEEGSLNPSDGEIENGNQNEEEEAQVTE